MKLLLSTDSSPFYGTSWGINKFNQSQCFNFIECNMGSFPTVWLASRSVSPLLFRPLNLILSHLFTCGRYHSCFSLVVFSVFNEVHGHKQLINVSSRTCGIHKQIALWLWNKALKSMRNVLNGAYSYTIIKTLDRTFFKWVKFTGWVPAMATLTYTTKRNHVKFQTYLGCSYGSISKENEIFIKIFLSGLFMQWRVSMCLLFLFIIYRLCLKIHNSE